MKRLIAMLGVLAVIANCGKSNSNEEEKVNTLPELTTANTIEITDNGATIGGNVLNDGGSAITSRGVCWSLFENPTIEDEKTIDGTGIGSYTSEITGLSPNTEYFVRAYATNGSGTAYGNELRFTTVGTLPVLTTKAISIVNEYVALSGGTISDDGGISVISKGICWSTNPGPTIDNDLSEDGEGIGEFTSKLRSLEPNTQYFVRAYVKNSSGTFYGNELSFGTPEAMSWIPRANMVYNTFYINSFAIDDVLYVGNGRRQFNTAPEENLFFKYNPTQDSWEEIASLPWGRRQSSISFSINGFGYVGFGQDCSGPPDIFNPTCTFVNHNDLWRYDPNSDSWSEMAKHPEDGGPFGTSFVIGEKAYVIFVGNELWEYNATTNAWQQKASYPGNCGSRRTAFAINDKGYVGFGITGKIGGNLICGDIWEYDPASDTWIQKADFPGGHRYNATGVGLDDYGFVCFGEGEEIPEFPWNINHKDVWRYDSSNDEWTLHLVTFPGEGRTQAIAEVVNNKIMLGLGHRGNDAFTDVWEFNPFAN